MNKVGVLGAHDLVLRAPQGAHRPPGPVSQRHLGSRGWGCIVGFMGKRKREEGEEPEEEAAEEEDEQEEDGEEEGIAFGIN